MHLMATVTNQMVLVDRILGGTLASFLRQTYAEEASWDRVARRLENEHQIVTTGVTVARWARALEVEDTPTEATA